MHHLTRRELLAQIGVPFVTLIASIDETALPGEPAERYVERLAREKALAGLATLNVPAGAVVLGADTAVVLKTWLNWQHSHVHKWGNDYWCMVQFGALLALAATGWVVTSAALITLLAPVPIETPRDFLLHVVLADEGWLFELWLALGSLMAAPIFLSSVVAMPLLLDRRASLRQAILTSWLAVLANPLPMALWAALILGFTLLGLGSLLLGMIAVMPMLGHASWHAYRDLVDASSLPLRESVHATPTQGGRP